MNLVAYSDSEASDDEVHPSSSGDPQPSAAPAKSGFHKVVDKSNPHKIRVNLPAATSLPADDSEKQDERPAKRPRIGGGGGGLFSGLSSFLPAPKRSGDGVAAATGARGLGRGPGKGVSLKTGAAPAFSRERPESASLVGSGDGVETLVDAEQKEPVDATPEPEVKLVGKATVFKPLSVARNAKKKKKPLVVASNNPVSGDSAPKSSSNNINPTVVKPIVPAKPKVSLFSIGTQDDSLGAAKEAHVSAESYGYDDDEQEDAGGLEHADAATFEQHSYAATDASTGPQTLDTVASDLNLDEASRRRLFGRRGKAGDMPVNLVNFNTDAEYAANEIIRAAGETIQHNPVRGIQPGKHSLKQLVNAASTQKEALEEHWAAGKRNKREAGNKYGW